MTLRSVTAGVIATAMVATAATPAAAQRYNGYGYDHGRYQRHDNTGAVIGGVVAIGVIAAIAAAAASNRGNSRYNGYNNDYNGYRSNIRNENQAAEACAIAAQDRFGARIDGIDQVYRTRGGFVVSGTVEGRGNRGGYGYGRGYDRGYGNDYGRGYGRSFSCEVRYGQIAALNLGRRGY